VQLLSVKSGFVNHRLNDPSGIRVYIEEIINKERWNDLIILEYKSIKFRTILSIELDRDVDTLIRRFVCQKHDFWVWHEPR
jgi:hypothetical protein